MVLPGLKFAIPIGYIFGCFLIVWPWGNPRFSWCSLPTFLSIIFVPCFIFVNIDIICHHNDKLEHFTQNSTDRVDRLVTICTYVELIISCIAMRLVLFVKAKKICNVLVRLRKFSKARLTSKLSKWLGAGTHTDRLVSAVVFLSTFGIASLDGWDCYAFGIGRSWIREWCGPWVHAFVVVVLFIMPAMIPLQCAFALIVALTGYLSVIFQDYCQHVLDSVQQRKWLGMSIVGPKLPRKSKEKTDICMNKDCDGFTDQLRVEILARFEIVREIFDSVHEIISPMALVLLSGACIAVVMKAYEIALLKKENIQIIRDVCHMLNYLCYYWILQCGQRLSDKIESMKGKLEEVLIDLSSDIHFLEKQTVKDVQGVIKMWNWKFTAFDVFVINRSLASGVLSLIMTYVVVLVQLKVSDEPDTVVN